MDKEHEGKGVMSESNSDVTDEGKKEHKGDEGGETKPQGALCMEGSLC